MAARRFSPKHDQATRDKIKTSQLLNRLMALSKGEIEMAPHAVTAALGLLRKVLPDLSAQDVTIETAHPFSVLPAVIPGETDWEEAFTPAPKATEH